MGRCAVFASGKGSNFRAILEHLASTPHDVALLVTDKSRCGAVGIATEWSVPVRTVTYRHRHRTEAEREIQEAVDSFNVDLIALAGFMRVLSPNFVNRYRNRIINIHPSLLPKYPGRDALLRAYYAGETELGLTVHYVDEGVDTGPIIEQASLQRHAGESLEYVQARIHELEHEVYPGVVCRLLEEADLRSFRLHPSESRNAFRQGAQHNTQVDHKGRS